MKKEIEVKEKEFFLCNVIKAFAGTTGGNMGKLDITYTALEDIGGTYWKVNIYGVRLNGRREFRISDNEFNDCYYDSKKQMLCIKQPTKVELVFDGSSELDTLISALEFILNTLKEQRIK